MKQYHKCYDKLRVRNYFWQKIHCRVVTMDKPSTNLQSHRYSFTKCGETPPEPTILNDYRQTSVENEDVVGQVLLRLHLRDQQFYCLLTYVLYYRFEGIYAMACFTKGGVDCQISFDGFGFSFVYPFIFLKYRVYFSLVRCCGLDLKQFIESARATS